VSQTANSSPNQKPFAVVFANDSSGPQGKEKENTRSKTKTQLMTITAPQYNLRLPITFTSEPPTNPELRKVAEDILNSLKYSFAATAANPQMNAKGRADALFCKFHQTRNTQKRAIYQKTAQAFLQAPDTARQATFGRYGSLKEDQYAKVGSDGVASLVGNFQITQQSLATALNRAAEDHTKVVQAMTVVEQSAKGTAGQKTQEKGAGTKYKKLGLYLTKVECIEETDDGIGSDEIRLGGTATGAGGVTWKIPALPAMEDFDDHETRYFNPDKLFAEFRLDGGGDHWPKTFGVVLAMAEEDWGGFGDFLNDLWNLVDDKVKAAIGIVASAAFAAAIGNVLVGIAVFVIGALVDWFISLAKDDIFTPKPILLTLARSSDAYFESLNLAKKTPSPFSINFVGFDGHYRVWAYFKVQA
jgi:hypothetical protein